MKRALGRLRIIGGTHRRRLIAFDAATGVRPTPDRVRQTVFDWLSPLIEGARCLDLFAGSGALGFEALSRGAAKVTLVETATASYHRLCAAAEELSLGARCQVVHRDAFAYLGDSDDEFDIAFIDPPFDSDLLVPAVDALRSRLRPLNRIYVEWAGAQAPALPVGVSWLREKRAGQVSYGLVSYVGGEGPGSEETSSPSTPRSD
jgi:16S rRNA (guanine966-N2)-methyltransferase